MGAWLVSFALALTLVSGSRAIAQDARSLFVQGQEAYQAGSYESAIDAWERAYAMDPRPALQYNLAQAYGRLARIEEERNALRLYIDGVVAAGADPTDSQLTSARARMRTIDDRIRRTGIQLAGVPAGAEVIIDGAPSASANGETILLSPGPHQIQVSAAGREDFNASIVVRAGESMAVPVQMRHRTDSDSQASGGMSGGRLGAVLCWSVGGASLLTGSILGGLALGKSDGAIDGSSQADSARGMALGSDITIAAGAALGVTGLVLYLVSDDGDDEAPAVAVAPIVTPRSAGLQVFGRF